MQLSSALEAKRVMEDQLSRSQANAAALQAALGALPGTIRTARLACMPAPPSPRSRPHALNIFLPLALFHRARAAPRDRAADWRFRALCGAPPTPPSLASPAA